MCIIKLKSICRHHMQLLDVQETTEFFAAFIHNAVRKRCNYLTLNGSDYFVLWRKCLETQKRPLCWHEGYCKIQSQKPLHPPRPLFHLHMGGSSLRGSPKYESVSTERQLGFLTLKKYIVSAHIWNDCKSHWYFSVFGSEKSYLELLATCWTVNYTTHTHTCIDQHKPCFWVFHWVQSLFQRDAFLHESPLQIRDHLTDKYQPDCKLPGPSWHAASDPLRGWCPGDREERRGEERHSIRRRISDR